MKIAIASLVTLVVIALSGALALANVVSEPSAATQFNYDVSKDGMITLTTPVEPNNHATIAFVQLPQTCWDAKAFEPRAWGRMHFGKNYYGNPVCRVEPNTRWY